MSRGFKIVLAIIFIPLILIILLGGLLAFLLSSPKDYLVAKTIPIYPQSTYIKVSSKSAFPDSPEPSADIQFYTDANQNQLLNFYGSKLKSQGWEEKVNYFNEGEHGIGNTIFEGTKVMQVIYTKKVFGTNYVVQFIKTDITDEQKLRDYFMKLKYSDQIISSFIKEVRRINIDVRRSK